MTAGVFLADLGNIGLIVSAALTTAAVAAYAVRGAGHGPFPPWWQSPFGRHLMGFMVAFMIVLDEAAIYLLTTHSVFVAAVPFKADWFAWCRVLSYVILVPGVLAWRLAIILRPPGRTPSTRSPEAGRDTT